MTAQLIETIDTTHLSAPAGDSADLAGLPALPEGVQLQYGAQNEALIVLSKPACVQCKATERHLGKKDYESYVKIDMTEHLQWYELAKYRNHMQAPVAMVVRDGQIVDSWAGYIPGNLDRFVAENA